MKKLLSLTLILIACVSFGAVPAPFTDGVRPLGMGGVGTATVDDLNMLMYNPAQLAKANSFHMNIPEIQIETNQKTLDFISYFVDHSSLFTGNLSSWTTETVDKLTSASLKLKASVDLGATGINTPIGNFGFGLFATAYTNVSTQYDILNINAIMSTQLDLVLPVSYGTMVDLPFVNDVLNSTIGGKIGVGATVKVIQRYSLSETRSVFELSGLDPVQLLNKISSPQTGLGFDVGINYYQPAISSTFSLVGQNLFTSIGGQAVNGVWNFGYGFNMNVGIGNLVLGADVDDLFGNVTILNKLHLGGELQMLGIATVRVGAYQGWTSFGVNLFGILDYANYGIELGLYPGQIEEREHRVSIGFKF